MRSMRSMITACQTRDATSIILIYSALRVRRDAYSYTQYGLQSPSHCPHVLGGAPVAALDSWTVVQIWSEHA